MAWFITGLRHEAIWLAKKHRRLKEHELLILNNLISQDAKNDETERLDTVAATDNILAEVEEMVFLQETLSLLTPQ
ncbi:DNA-directed RNA polymerase specialized sigma subunit, sigma24-like protein [Thermosediminibacter oceani DSM 16646]|uniref:DNA-directed RNA polymerase specialized sigma subunit, sigma24-like protein n=1 Tax=Thermosediminibacter oceani (strain ATCC BAA-1034 / DSM 16646 / JW/IW-1228P) TaxID=555079 RepID=D9S161_THEOJ|nr:DNA-directed RNA polymerase specialized sigma subunit, sigma24-like protein [Thermosediminibacter oceani DSM 16646]